MDETRTTSLDQYRLLGRSGLRVSPMCLGTMTFGTEWGWGADKKESRRILDLYLDRGGNFIDTANFYTQGTSETYLGEFLEDKRDSIVLATKYSLNPYEGDPNGGGNHRKSLMRNLDASLKRLKTDYIDLFYVHVWEFRTPMEEVMRALDDAVRQGKVLYVGISDTPAWVVSRMNTLAECRGWSPFISLQVPYSLIERSIERELVPMARELGMGVAPWGMLGSGLLSGKYNDLTLEDVQANPPSGRRSIPNRMTAHNLDVARSVAEIADEIGATPAQAALAWVLHQTGITSPILGVRNAEQLEDNLGALRIEFGEEHLKRLNEVSGIDLGFPHDLLASDSMSRNVTGGTVIERRG